MFAPCSNNAGRGTPFLRPRGFCSSRTSQRGRVGPPAPKLKLEPAPATVPAPTEEYQHYQDDDEEGGGVHVALPGRDAVYVSDWRRTGWVSSSASRWLNGRWPNFVPASDSTPVTLLPWADASLAQEEARSCLLRPRGQRGRACSIAASRPDAARARLTTPLESHPITIHLPSIQM